MRRIHPSPLVAAVLSALVVVAGVGVGALPAQAAATLSVGAGKSYTSIQSAVDAASAGDTIAVDPGTYTENLVIDKPLVILGANQGVAGTAVRGAESLIVSASPTVATIQATQAVTLDGIAVQQASVTTNVNNVAVSLGAGSEGSQIRNSVVQQARIGVAVSSSTASGETKIESSLLSEWTLAGVRSVTSHGLSVQDNTFSVAATGADAASAAVLLYNANVNSLVQNNKINAKVGVSVDGRSTEATSGVRILGNTIDLNQAQALPVGIAVATRNVSDVTIADNTISSGGHFSNIKGINGSNTGTTGTAPAHGLVLSKNVIDDADTAISIPNAVDDVTITGNDITAVTRAISFQSGATNTKIDGNTLRMSGTSNTYAVLAQGDFSNSAITGNTFENVDFAAYFSASNFKDISFSKNVVASLRGFRVAGTVSNNDISITDNHFKTVGTSISTAGLQTRLVVTGNQIIGGADGMAFSVTGGQGDLVDSKIEGNSLTLISGNHITAASAAAAAASAPASGNYWGRTSANRYPAFKYVNVDGSRALPVDPFTKADNTPTTAPDPTGAPEASSSVSGGILTADLKGMSLLGLKGTANSDSYPYVVAEGEWVKAYFVKDGSWSAWAQAPTDGVFRFAAPEGVEAGEAVLFINFAGDVFAQTPADKLGIAPAIVTKGLAGATVGTAYSTSISATGSAPLALSITAGALPDGMKMTSDGRITGVPTKAGTFQFTVTASNGVDPDAQQAFSIVVAAKAVPTLPATPKADASDGTKISGSAVPGSTVTVKDSKNKVLCTVVANATSGKFSCTLVPALKDGAKITVTATTKAGTSRPATVTVKKTVTQPASCSEPRKVAVFADTPVSHKFYKDIDWMECMKYSTGWRQPVGKPIYKPADNLQRQAMAAFIYRMEAPKNYVAPKESPFADVKTSDTFYKQIAWMYEKGYSTGWVEPSGKPTYRPLDSLSREAMAAFIYRLEASKDPSVKSYKAPTVSPLADMKPGAKFYKEISWMYDSKLSTGNKVGSKKEYWPKDDLSRQAMAAFIHRLVVTYRAGK